MSAARKSRSRHSTGPELCVIVPIYNAADTLRDCVESVLSQQVEGGLWCLLCDDGSTDGSAKLCSELAEHDARIKVLRGPNRGVSAARNRGLAAVPAATHYIVFLDADDRLLPGALATAMLAQKAHPKSFVLWGYTTDEAVAAKAAAQPPSLDGPPPMELLPASALAQLQLGCLLAMPWNKLFRARLARSIKFNESYTLGEDLRFVISYLHLLPPPRTGAPRYTLVQLPLNYYNCQKTDGTLSTRYLPNACQVWLEHFSCLNMFCEQVQAPKRDMRQLYRAELTVLAQGVADLWQRDPAPAAQRRRRIADILNRQELQSLLLVMNLARCYSPYYLPFFLHSRVLICQLVKANRNQSPLFGKLDWGGYYLLLGRFQRD